MEDEDLKKIWDSYKREQNPDLKKELITNYLPLVKAIAIRLSAGLPKHISLDDLISSGVCGLITSIDKFNPDSGTRFKSFAGLRIHGAMLDELRSLDWVPRSVRSRSKQLQLAYNTIQQEKGRFATDSEVAEFLNIPLENLDSFIESTKIINLVSLDAKIYKEESGHTMNFSEIIADKSQSLPIGKLSKDELKQTLVDAIHSLSKQEQIVLTLYYFEELTLKEIGSVIGVSESRVSQIHSKSLYRLKAKISLSEISDYAPN